MLQERELSDIQALIERWERGDEVWSDPPLCTLLVAEIHRLRRVLSGIDPSLLVDSSTARPHAAFGATRRGLRIRA